MNQPIQPTQDDIARQAQRLWQERGCPEGHHEEIWLEAEDQLTNSPFGEGRKDEAASPEGIQPETATANVAAPQKPDVRTRKPRHSNARIKATELDRAQPA